MVFTFLKITIFILKHVESITINVVLSCNDTIGIEKRDLSLIVITNNCQFLFILNVVRTNYNHSFVSLEGL